MTRVIHTGQALVDVVIEVPDLPARGQNVMATSVAERAGGAVTVLTAAARFGARCVHAGAHGTGPRGDLVREALAREGVGLSAPRIPGRDTGICVVLVEPSAQRTFVTTLGAEREISAASLSTSTPRSGDLVCVSGFSLAIQQTRDPLLTWLGSLDEGVVVVLDPGSAFAGLHPEVRTQMLAHTDVWSSNAEEATDLLAAVGRTPDEPGLEGVTAAIAPLLRGEAVTIVRDGARGCAVLTAGHVTTVPGYPQTPLDTNGAGDTHTGALLAEVAAGTPWVDGCRRANAAAAIKVTRRGPGTAPSAAEVDDFLARQPV